MSSKKSNESSGWVGRVTEEYRLLLLDQRGTGRSTPVTHETLQRFETTMHFLGNVLIELDGDAAAVETYCVAYHRLVGQDVDSIAGLRYVDRLERRDDVWRIADRQIVVEWNRIDDVTSLGFGPEYVRGRHDHTDPAYG